MATRKRKCHNCKQLFAPSPSARYHQNHCSLGECQRARKAVNNRQFRKANPDYHKGTYHVDRVRKWRQDNPGYWRNEARNGGSGRKAGSALQAELKSEPIEDTLVALQQELTTLQAVSDRQDTLFQGLAVQLTGCALQAELQPILNAWYDKGKQFSGMQPLTIDNLTEGAEDHEKTNNSLAAARETAAHSTSL